jgi:hypothetical protein
MHIPISDWYEKWGGSLIQEPVRYLKMDTSVQHWNKAWALELGKM